MPLSDKAIKEFQDIYNSKFKEKINFEKARLKATDFIELVYLISKPKKD